MKIVAAEVAEYLYFLLIAIAFLVSSTIYWRTLDKIPAQEPVPDSWQTASSIDTCQHHLLPAAESSFFDFVPNLLAETGLLNDTISTDTPSGQICADLDEWKCLAVLGLIVGGLCLLQNPWFKMINCHSGPGRKRARKLTKASIKNTPGAKQISRAKPRLGIILYERAETEEKQSKDTQPASKTCCLCLYGCTVIWIALAYVAALIGIPIYLSLNLLTTSALKPSDLNLARPAKALLITCGVHVFCFVIILCSIIRKIVKELTKIRETNIDMDEDALWEEMQKKAKIVSANKV